VCPILHILCRIQHNPSIIPLRFAKKLKCDFAICSSPLPLAQALTKASPGLKLVLVLALLRVPDDPWRAFNLTFQLYQSIIFDHENGIRVSGAERINLYIGRARP
jgi:hypothetical protein